MRLIILEQDRYSRWIKIVGILLITLRFADWPYELAFHSIQEKLRDQAPGSGSQCWAEWYDIIGYPYAEFVSNADFLK